MPSSHAERMGIPRDMLGLGLVTEFGEAGHGIVFGNPVGPQVDEYGVPLKRKNKGIPEADSGMSPEDQARFDNALAELEEAAEDAKYDMESARSRFIQKTGADFTQTQFDVEDLNERAQAIANCDRFETPVPPPGDRPPSGGGGRPQFSKSGPAQLGTHEAAAEAAKAKSMADASAKRRDEKAARELKEAEEAQARSKEAAAAQEKEQREADEAAAKVREMEAEMAAAPPDSPEKKSAEARLEEAKASARREKIEADRAALERTKAAEKYEEEKRESDRAFEAKQRADEARAAAAAEAEAKVKASDEKHATDDAAAAVQAAADAAAQKALDEEHIDLSTKFDFAFPGTGLPTDGNSYKPNGVVLETSGGDIAGEGDACKGGHLAVDEVLANSPAHGKVLQGHIVYAFNGEVVHVNTPINDFIKKVRTAVGPKKNFGFTITFVEPNHMDIRAEDTPEVRQRKAALKAMKREKKSTFGDDYGCRASIDDDEQG